MSQLSPPIISSGSLEQGLPLQQIIPAIPAIPTIPTISLNPCLVAVNGRAVALRAMKRDIIVTDLTRFQKQELVCTAGIDRVNGECIRPVPYLKSARCEELNVLPGSILTGLFSLSSDRKGPHQENRTHTNLAYKGACTAAEFKRALLRGLFQGVEEGFEIELAHSQKLIPLGHPVRRSIITISVLPTEVRIIEHTFKPGRINLRFTDKAGRHFQSISITDMGFQDYAVAHHGRNVLLELNRFLHAQKEVLLRLGLSHRYQAPDGRDGYWLQANGIYTFPNYHQDIRSYPSS